MLPTGQKKLVGIELIENLESLHLTLIKNLSYPYDNTGSKRDLDPDKIFSQVCKILCNNGFNITCKNVMSKWS